MIILKPLQYQKGKSSLMAVQKDSFLGLVRIRRNLVEMKLLHLFSLRVEKGLMN